MLQSVVARPSRWQCLERPFLPPMCITDAGFLSMNVAVIPAAVTPSVTAPQPFVKISATLHIVSVQKGKRTKVQVNQG